MMISDDNKQLLFDLLFYIYILKNNTNQLNQYITYLQQELKLIEATDIASIDPKQFSKELQKEWETYQNYRQQFL